LSEIKCKICKKRGARYLRTYSGDLLCEVCLERSLIKAVKRAIGKYEVLKPRSKVLVPITYSSPHFSAALARILSLLETKFSTEVIIARPQDIYLDDVENWPPQNSKEIIVRVKADGINTSNLNTCLRFDRRWAYEVARNLGVKTIALPYTKTDIIIFTLNSLLIEGLEALSESLEYIEVNGIRFFLGFSEVEGEIVSAYVALKRLWFYSDKCKYEIPAKKVFYSIAYRRPELEYSSVKTIDPLLRAVSKKLNRCKYCGGFSQETVCKYCRDSKVVVEVLTQ
jgi:tRNA(Ile)-lysidine synthase TilS/MesJ